MASELKSKIDAAVALIRGKTDIVPEVGIILGTGLGGLADEIEADVKISYNDIPGFPGTAVESHAGELIVGKLAGTPVVALSGRFHCYEGYSPVEVTLPVRVVKGLGAGTLIISGATGGLNTQHNRGDIVIIEDHINMMGLNPLIGPNDDEVGIRFPDMSEPYSKELIAAAREAALEEKVVTHTGVYVGVTGPNLETRAEYRMLRMMGADIVGMSVVLEVIAAVHSGLKVLGFAVITDECRPDALEPADINEIIAVANAAEPKLTGIVKRILGA